MLRNRKIYDKLEEEDILDSADQDELLTAFKEDITKQQKISNYAFTVVFLLVGAIVMYALFVEQEGGSIHNLVALTTYGTYTEDKFPETLKIISIMTLFCLCYLWITKYKTMFLSLTLCVPFLALLIRYVSSNTSYPLLPVLYLLFPVLMYTSTSHASSLWTTYRHLETLTYTHKSV